MSKKYKKSTSLDINKTLFTIKKQPCLNFTYYSDNVNGKKIVFRNLFFTSLLD